MSKENDNKKSFMREWGWFIIAIIAIFLFKEYLYAPILVQGDSMDSTLKNNDLMILDKVSKDNINRFDIVVIRYDKKYLIKRVIGLPGETVEYINNTLYINKQKVEEPFLPQGTITDDFSLEFEIPKHCYFVMGDNRRISFDSRSLGCFDKSKIDGKTNLTIFPFDRIGTKK